jgi:monoamine oxidase
MREGKKKKEITRREFMVNMGKAGAGIMLSHALLAGEAEAAPLPIREGIGKGKHVVILGAGIAGLTAAYELLTKNSGFMCTILEANPVAGGRSLTLRPGDILEEDKFPPQRCTFVKEPGSPVPYFNAGAGRIPSAHVNLLGYCKKLNVPLEVYILENRSNFVYTNGNFGSGKKEAVNRQVAIDTKGWIAKELYPFVDQITGLNSRQKESFKSLLKAFGNLNQEGNYEGARGAGFNKLPGIYPGITVNPLSLPELLASRFWDNEAPWNLLFYQPDYFLWQPPLFQPVGGMDKIVKAFERDVVKNGGNIKKGAPVTGIKRKGSKIMIAYGSTGQVIEADYCISTIPIPLLRTPLELEGFSREYREALETIYKTPTFLEPSCKVGWQAERRFWQPLPEGETPLTPPFLPMFGGISRTSHEITQMWYPSDDYYAKFGILTGAYNYGDIALKWGNLPPEKRLETAREGAAQLHGAAFARNVSRGIAIAWQNMPYARGGRAVWNRVENGGRHYNNLLRGDGNFFICGDQLSQLSGWQEGAVLSAHHTVKLITETNYKKKFKPVHNLAL